MIVRDEAELLPGCLASVREAVDEIIVVDTGSADGTPELAKRAGAQVFPFDWCDDFAAARNVSVHHASGDWVLWLDADERLAPGADVVIRQAVAEDAFDCGLMLLHNASRLDASAAEVLSGRARLDDAVLQRRLLRRTPDLRFSGIAHEHLGPWLEEGRRRTITLPAHVIHLGYAPELMQARGKQARNRRLLESAVEREPNDSILWGYLAQTYLQIEQPERAWRAVEQGWRYLPNPEAGDRPAIGRLATIRAQMQLGRGELKPALATLAQAERIQGAHPDFDFLRGEAHLAQAQQAATERKRDSCLALAERAYEAAVQRRNWVSTLACISGASSYRPRVGLGNIWQERGDFARALGCYEAAAAEAPWLVEAQVGRARALIALGDEERLLGLLQELEGTDARWLTSALTAEYLGCLADFSSLLDGARNALKETARALPVAEELEAAFLRLVAYLGRPRGGTGIIGAVGAVLVGELPQRPPVGLSVGERVQVALLLRNLVRSGREELVLRLTTAQAERALPGIAGLAAQFVAAPVSIPPPSRGRVRERGRPPKPFAGIAAVRIGATLMKRPPRVSHDIPDAMG